MAHELELSSHPPRTATALYVILWVVWAGLLLMPLTFVGVMSLLFAQRTDPPNELQPILSIVWLAWLVVGIGGATIARWFLLRRMQKRRPGNFAGTYFTATLIWWSLIEGAVYFGFVLCLIGGAFSWHVFVAVAMLGLTAISFPKRRLASRV